MKAIVGLIVGAIGVFIAVGLLKPVTDSVKSVTDAVTTVTTTGTQGVIGTTTTPAYSSGVTALVGVLPIVFVAVIILGAVAWVGGEGIGIPNIFGWLHRDKEESASAHDTTELIKTRTNSAHTISVVEKASEVLLQYQNDLEGLLGIKTAVDNHKYFGLDLTGNTLAINEEDYDWYITAKQKNENVFKVIGLNKTDAANNAVYVLGNHILINTDASRTDRPFLIKVPVTRVADEIAVPRQMSVEGRS